MTKCRQERDNADMEILLQYMRINNPFSQEQDKLINIVSGVALPEFVNVDAAENVGNEIIKKIIGLLISEFIPRKKDQWILMTTTKNP